MAEGCDAAEGIAAHRSSQAMEHSNPASQPPSSRQAHLAGILHSCTTVWQGPARLLAAGGRAAGALRAAGIHGGAVLLPQLGSRAGVGRWLGRGAGCLAAHASAAHGRSPIG